MTHYTCLRNVCLFACFLLLLLFFLPSLYKPLCALKGLIKSFNSDTFFSLLIKTAEISLLQIFSSDLAFVVDVFFFFLLKCRFSQKTLYFALWKCLDSVTISNNHFF